ncbi:hypothetical protein KSP40_PGU014588 [Platanthera guangdongensis]|uniref:Uncharacterized protein n=1 Tax=Platanthera guangdongensis TaxID=2320717 RepID=A0ABR2M9W2_9ASPA
MHSSATDHLSPRAVRLLQSVMSGKKSLMPMFDDDDKKWSSPHGKKTIMKKMVRPKPRWLKIRKGCDG